MKITKFTHSCLLIEDGDKTTLLDPGEFSWGELLKEHLSDITKLDYLGITHEHADHFVPDVLQEIVNRFPDAKVMCGPAVAAKLAEAGINCSSDSDDYITLHVGEHQHLFQGLPVFENTQIIVGGRLLTLGDSMHPAVENVDIMAVPFFGPWFEGTFSDAIELMIKHKPTNVIPVHDWHYNDKARADFHGRASGVMADHDVTVHQPTDGEPITID